MSDLPEPLTPPDCDLRGYEYMPVFGNRLFGSELYARATDAEFRAAMRLWWAAWQQCPAGSLPADDRALALLADFGRDVRRFKAVREVALHGFVKCNDGRLYHPLLCNEARLASERRKKERMRKADYRSRHTETSGPGSNGSNGLDEDVPRDKTGTSAGRDADVQGRGEDRTVREESKQEVRGRNLPVAPARAPIPEDYQPAAKGEALAMRLGLDVLRTLIKFRGWYRSKAVLSADWDGQWEVWCVGERERMDRDAASKPPVYRNGMIAVAVELRQARQAAEEPQIVPNQFLIAPGSGRNDH